MLSPRVLVHVAMSLSAGPDVIMHNLMLRSFFDVAALVLIFTAWRFLRFSITFVLRGLTQMMRNNRVLYLLAELPVCIPVAGYLFFVADTYLEDVMETEFDLEALGFPLGPEMLWLYKGVSALIVVLCSLHVCAEAPDARQWSKTLFYYLFLHGCYAFATYLPTRIDTVETPDLIDYADACFVAEVAIAFLSFTYIISVGTVTRAGLTEYRNYIPFRAIRVIVMACMTILAFPLWRFLMPLDDAVVAVQQQTVYYPLIVILVLTPLWRFTHGMVWGRWPTIAGMIPPPILADLQRMVETAGASMLVDRFGRVTGILVAAQESAIEVENHANTWPDIRHEEQVEQQYDGDAVLVRGEPLATPFATAMNKIYGKK